MPWGSCRQTWRREGCPPLPHHLVCVEKFTLPYLTNNFWRPPQELFEGAWSWRLEKALKIKRPTSPSTSSTRISVLEICLIHAGYDNVEDERILVLEKTPQTRHGPFWLSAEILS